MISNRNETAMKWKNPSVRRTKDRAARIVGYAILVAMMGLLASIFAYIFGGGLSFITLKMLTTNGNITNGGLLNSIAGTWMLVGVGLLMSLPAGLLGSLYHVQARKGNRLSSIMRLFTDILTSVPSIVIGLFGYLVIVLTFNTGFSLVAGGIALGIMMLPYIMRVSEISMREVSRKQVENAYALGADNIQVAGRIYLPQAFAGIISGVLLAVSIAAGETAQLLYTANFSSTIPTGFLHQPVGYLTYVVYEGILQPGAYANHLAFVAAFVLIVSITALIAISKFVSYRKR